MRLVLDTNVLIAAFIARGVCHEVYEYCALHHEVALSAFILLEFERHLTGKFGFGREESDRACQLLRSRAVLVAPVETGDAVCRDPDDDRVLGAALAGSCTCLLTGDKDLLVLDPFCGIRIIPPSEFWRFEMEHGA